MTRAERRVGPWATGGHGGLQPGVTLESNAALLEIMGSLTVLEAGWELVTADRDLARFAGLLWRHPLMP